ncbi:MAG TPA: hypothetical protein VLB46_09375 [Pyrinomonadaceae bacterium]|nr:hypothetical protein [Pyrinomonadaceae bacterium]
MSKPLDDAIRRGLDQKDASARQQQSAEAQKSHLWERIKQSVEQGCDRINGDNASQNLAGGKLIYEPSDGTYLSNSDFQVKNEVIPGRRLRVSHCDKFLSVVLTTRFLERGEDREEELSAEELHFRTDEDGHVFVSRFDQKLSDKNGRLYTADVIATYMLEKFWSK